MLRCRPHHLFFYLFISVLMLLPLSAQAETFSEYDLLLLDFTLERQPLGQVVTAYSFKGSIVVSLAEAGAALEFPLVVDVAAGTASGWFLSKERQFELDINVGTVIIEGVTQRLNRADAIVFEHGIYVPIEAFSHWFPVHLTAQLTTMSIEVVPEELLPVQLRAQRRKLAGQRYILAAASLPEIEMPYRLLGSHSADFFVGYHVRRNIDEAGDISAPQTSLSHSALVRGDLAYMTSAIYLGGNDIEPLSYARLTLSRSSPDTPKGIRLIELGDITPEAIRGASQNGIERGLLIRGSSSKGNDLYSLDGSQTYISGDVLEGWEVELLHNGIRLDYQVIGAEGRYDFRDLDLYNGVNTFELIFYGPAGEERSEIITRYAGVDAIRQGNLSYRFSASQKGETVYESPVDRVLVDELSDRGSARYSGRLDYGVLSNLSINTAWSSVVENGERLNYYSLGFSTGFRSISMSVNASKDPLGGTIINGVVNLPATLHFWGFNTQFRHTQYARSVLAKDDTDGTQINSRSSLVLTGDFDKISSRFSAAHSRLIGRTTTTYSADVSRATSFFRLGNTLNYQVFDGLTLRDNPSLLDGNIYFSSKLEPLTLRGNINYRIKPESEPRQYNLNVDVRIASDMSMKFSLDYTPTNELTRYSAGMNWKLDYVTLTPRLSYDSEGRYSGFVFASFALAAKQNRRGVLFKSEPMANNGGVTSRVFFDHDNDGVFGVGDKPLANVEVYAPQLFRKAKTDEQGVAYLTGLRPNKTTDVQLDNSSLPGLSMYSPYAGNSVRPRPGRWAHIDFPVTASGEVDGVLYQQRNGKKWPLPGVMVELRNGDDELVDFKISAHDGFFLFDFVPFGEYRVTVPQAKRGRLMQTAPIFQLNQDNLLQSNVVLVLTAKKFVIPRLFPSFAKAEADVEITTLIPPPSVADVVEPYVLQLGAYRQQAVAERAMEQLRQRYRGLLSELVFQVKRSDLGAKGVFFRVYGKGSFDETQAKARCRQLSQQGQACFAVAQP